MTTQELQKYVNSPMECTEIERENARQYLRDDIENTMSAIDMMLKKALDELEKAQKVGKKKKKPSRKPGIPGLQKVNRITITETPPCAYMKAEEDTDKFEPTPELLGMMYARETIDALFCDDDETLCLSHSFSAPAERSISLIDAMNTYLSSD